MKGWNVWKYYALAAGIIILDQIVKLAVHYNMNLGAAGEIHIFGDWFKLHYTLNEGMAFGLKADWKYGKLLLTTFRLFAMVGIGYYLFTLIQKQMPKGLLWCIAMILAGAIGNVVDSTFYGVFLDNASKGVITPWFHGKVVDMFYFDIAEGFYPDWVPVLGGQYYSFWPIFNIADASIFIGVCIILIFQKKYFAEPETPNGIVNDQATI